MEFIFDNGATTISINRDIPDLDGGTLYIASDSTKITVSKPLGDGSANLNVPHDFTIVSYDRDVNRIVIRVHG